MRIINIGETEYTLEYTFAAAEHNQTVQKMFDLMSGAYIFKQAENPSKMTVSESTMAMINGTGAMVADIPHVVKTAFYSGLLEHHEDIDEKEAYKLLKQYMRENKFSFMKVFNDIKACMEEDGFFDLSGLTEMLEEMNKGIEEDLNQKQKQPKKPTDHKKKQTSTK